MPRSLVITIVVSPDLSEVVMMHKLRGPEGVVGRINFPGGGLEEGETPEMAASREDEEELGLGIPEHAWVRTMEKISADVSLYTLIAISPAWHQARTCTDEPVFVTKVQDVLDDAHSHPERYARDVERLLIDSLEYVRERALVQDASPNAPSPRRIRP